MKIISKIKIHPFFYLFACICIFNGLFKDFIYIMSIILFHELGHILVGLYYKWKIKKVVILPMGGITIFECFINTKLKEEFLVTLAGPLFQSLLFLISNEKYLFYNKLLFIFNLIPIVPLDGSKILNVIFNKIFSFKKSFILTNIVSILLIVILLFSTNNLIEFLIIFLLVLKVVEMFINKNFIFNKFLFERYLYNFNFRKNKIIKNNDRGRMKKDYKHLFYINNRYKTEKEYLREMFDK